MKIKNNINAFTLVELIVVITILAILGTIAFINLSGYSTGARDSKRLSDVNNIIKKVGIEEIKGVLPTDFINNQSSKSVTINNLPVNAIQGIPNFTKLKEEENSFKDPTTKQDYILSYAKGGTSTGAYKFTQIATINEEKNEAVVKGNYYMIDTINDSPSIVKNNSNVFVIDGGTELPYDLVGGAIVVASRYPGCDVDDIMYGSYILSACNLGTNIAGTGILSYGGLYQWGNNYDFRDGQITNGDNYSGIISSTLADASSNGPSNYYNNSTFVLGSGIDMDWVSSRNNNLWGDTSGSNLDRQGPCAIGYHIPTVTEWEGLISVGGWSLSNGDTMVEDLLLPKAGARYGYDAFGYSGATIEDGGGDCSYWTSSPNTVDVENAHFIGANSFGIASDSFSRSFAFSVRCFKN